MVLLLLAATSALQLPLATALAITAPPAPVAPAVAELGVGTTLAIALASLVVLVVLAVALVRLAALVTVALVVLTVALAALAVALAALATLVGLSVPPVGLLASSLVRHAPASVILAVPVGPPVVGLIVFGLADAYRITPTMGAILARVGVVGAGAAAVLERRLGARSSLCLRSSSVPTGRRRLIVGT
ncbi:MAG: hypothetical protein WBW80_19565, partial [Acidimicrobiales bacterium]